MGDMPKVIWAGWCGDPSFDTSPFWDDKQDDGLQKYIRADRTEQLAATNKELEAKLAKALEDLDRLARLGNGDTYGNSEGNMIARTTIAELSKERSDEKGQDDE